MEKSQRTLKIRLKKLLKRLKAFSGFLAKKLKPYEGTLIILFCFFFSSLLEEWLKVSGHGKPSDWNEYVSQMTLLSYVVGYKDELIVGLIVIMMWKRSQIRFDVWDVCLLGIMELSNLVNKWDYYDNDGLRPTWLDWPVFLTAICVTLLLKIFLWKTLQKTIFRIQRLL